MAIKLELVGNSIHLRMPYSKTGTANAKKVRGATFLKNKKRWQFPLDYNTCVEIREKICDPMEEEPEIGPELWKWAENERDRLLSIPDPNSLERAELPVLAKAFPFAHKALNNRPFQTVGVKFAAEHRRVVIADDPGLGKTIQTIGAVIESNIRGPILIVAPKAAAELTWPQQIDYWAPGEHYTTLAGLTPKRRQEAIDVFQRKAYPEVGINTGQRQWLIVNPYWIMVKAELDDKGNYKRSKHERDEGKGMFYKMEEIFDIEWSAVIIDESHDILIANTMNRKKWTQTRIGAEHLWYRDNPMKIAMSGTPMRGKKENFFGTLQWLKPDLYKSYWKWADRHFDVLTDGYNKSVGGLKDPDQFYSDLKEVMIRRTKAEVAKDLPAKIYGGTRLDPQDPESPVGIWLDMTGVQAKQYASMLRDGAVNVEGGTMIANGLLSEWTRLKQLATSAGRFEGDKFVPSAPSNKMDWTMEFLADRGITKSPEGDTKVILVSQFAEVCKFMKRTLESEGIPSFILVGETPFSKRQEAMEAFQSDSKDVRVFILSTKAGGVSLTLDAADDVVIWDETYIPDNQLQVEDRAHRVSRPDHQVSIWYLRSRGSIEEAIAATTGGRQGVMDLILDKSRGVEIRRQIKEYTPKPKVSA